MTPNLNRFVDAQNAGGTFDRALAELRAGRKATHWLWFVLPQLAGLGSSDMARRFGIADLAEARAYAAHPVLGPRLVACCEALLAQPNDDAVDVLGAVDARKLRSSMTLFARAQPDELVFAQVLDRFFGGERDELTLELLGR